MKNNPHGIKNIIFDLGGVLLNIDYTLTIKAFGNLGIKHPEKAFSKSVQAEIFQKLECGHISNTDFIERIRDEIPEVEPFKIIEAWNAMLLDFPRNRYELLKDLSKKYRLFVLSNTNAIHLEAFRKIIDQSVGWENFEKIFEGIGYSHELHERKPNREIFEKLLSQYNLTADETLFIDDTEMHVKTANSIGIKAIHLKEDREITDILKEY